MWRRLFCPAFVWPAILIGAPLLVGLGAAEAMAADLTDQLEPGGTATVTEVIDGDTVMLDDGREVRLVGLQAPKLPLGREGFEPWPLADEAKEALAALIDGRGVRLGYGGLRTDRHRRALAHLFLEDGSWVQGAMLDRGLARVYSFADNRALVGEMYAREGRARAARLGIWADPFYAPRSPAETPRFIGGFEIVEGRVLDAARVRGRIYLNFGPDWRTDFTVMIPRAAWKLFEEAGIDPLAYEGREIRVRGWLREWNGPMIEVDHPEQIEIR